MTKRLPGSPSGAFNAKAVKVIQQYKAGIGWNNRVRHPTRDRMYMWKDVLEAKHANKFMLITFS